MRRIQKPGDIDLIPAGMDGSWKDESDCRILRLELRPSLLEQVAEELGQDVSKIDLIPRLQFRDARIEAIGWAIKTDLEAETPSDPLYIDSLANALAVRLIETAADRSAGTTGCRAPRMSARQLRLATDFIETNLDQKLHLADLNLSQQYRHARASICASSSYRIRAGDDSHDDDACKSGRFCSGVRASKSYGLDYASHSRSRAE
jgi:AraC family transcriptional regulator